MIAFELTPVNSSPFVSSVDMLDMKNMLMSGLQGIQFVHRLTVSAGARSN